MALTNLNGCFRLVELFIPAHRAARLPNRSVAEIREGLNFTGPVISDDMQMGAITNLNSPTDTSVADIRAGNALLARHSGASLQMQNQANGDRCSFTKTTNWTQNLHGYDLRRHGKTFLSLAPYHSAKGI